MKTMHYPYVSNETVDCNFQNTKLNLDSYGRNSTPHLHSNQNNYPYLCDSKIHVTKC